MWRGTVCTQRMATETTLKYTYTYTYSYIFARVTLVYRTRLVKRSPFSKSLKFGRVNIDEDAGDALFNKLFTPVHSAKHDAIRTMQYTHAYTQ